MPADRNITETDIDSIADSNPAPADTGSANATELDAMRALVLRAHPDAVPAMITGETVAELLASIEPARVAWQSVVERVGSPPAVPAGGERPVAVDPELLSPGEKIRRGLMRDR